MTRDQKPKRRGTLGRLPWVTLGLVVVQVAVYVGTAAAGPLDVDAMVRFGAKVGPLITEAGQPWRLLTANFLHRDGVHLGLNVLVLLATGWRWSARAGGGTTRRCWWPRGWRR